MSHCQPAFVSCGRLPALAAAAHVTNSPTSPPIPAPPAHPPPLQTTSRSACLAARCAPTWSAPAAATSAPRTSNSPTSPSTSRPRSRCRGLGGCVCMWCGTACLPAAAVPNPHMDSAQPLLAAAVPNPHLDSAQPLPCHRMAVINTSCPSLNLRAADCAHHPATAHRRRRRLASHSCRCRTGCRPHRCSACCQGSLCTGTP